MLSIYDYSCPHQFLRDSWEEKRKINSSFSMRSWATRLGFKNNSPLSLMLKGKRPIPKKYVPHFIDSLNLSPKEGLYLEVLVDLGREKNIERKDFYYRRLKSLAPEASINMSEANSFKFFGDPIHMIILEMSVLKDFSLTPENIQSSLRWRYKISEIKNAIQVLLDLGFLIRDKHHQLVKGQGHLTNRVDVADRGSQKYHQNVSHMAANAITEQNILEREFNGYALNIKKQDIHRAKVMMREFVKDFISQIEAKEDKGEETYQLNLQFFSLTKDYK